MEPSGEQVVLGVIGQRQVKEAMGMTRRSAIIALGGGGV
jgi:hypothetical protein